MKSAY